MVAGPVYGFKGCKRSLDQCCRVGRGLRQCKRSAVAILRLFFPEIVGADENMDNSGFQVTAAQLESSLRGIGCYCLLQVGQCMYGLTK